MGPFAQLDEFGIDVALEVGRTLYRSFSERMIPSALLIGMFKAGRLGRKSGEGFYFENGQRSDSIVAMTEAIILERSRDAAPVSDQDLQRRLIPPMLLEAMRALEESLVDSPAVVDRALRDGLGMTKQYRGLFAWADSIVASCDSIPSPRCQAITPWTGTPSRAMGMGRPERSRIVLWGSRPSRW